MPEDLAFPLTVRVQPGFPGAVEQLQCQSIGGAGVGLVEMAGPAEVKHAPLAHRQPLHVVRVLGQVVHQKAFAQAAHRHDPDLLEAQVLHEHVENGRPAHDDVCPVGVQPGDAAPLLEGESAQHGRGPAQLVAAEYVGVVGFRPPACGSRNGR